MAGPGQDWICVLVHMLRGYLSTCPFASLKLFLGEAHPFFFFLIPQCIVFSQCLGSHLLEFKRSHKINDSSMETSAVTDGSRSLTLDSLLFNLGNLELPDCRVIVFF